MTVPSRPCTRCGAVILDRPVQGVRTRSCARCGELTADGGERALQRLKQRTAEPRSPVSGREGALNEPRLSPSHLPDVDVREPALVLGSMDEEELPTEESELLTLDEDAFDLQLKALQEQRQRRSLVLLFAAAAVVVLALSIPAGYVVFRLVQGQLLAPVATSPAEPGVGLDEVLAESAPSEEPHTLEPSRQAEADAAEPQPAPELVEAPAPPTPVPAPRRAPDPFRALLQQGWNQVGSDPARAAETFRRALELNPDHHEANYGYGYALLQQGNHDGAGAFLCKARGGPDVEVERDVRSLIRRNAFACE